MLRLRLWVLAAVLAGASSLVVISSVDAASSKSIVGTWSGYLTPSQGSHAQRRHFTMIVYPGERTGRWRLSAGCSGTLRLKDISNGYHHYYRVVRGNARCVAAGVDCLEREGAQMADVFVSKSGTANTSGQFRRLR